MQLIAIVVSIPYRQAKNSPAQFKETGGGGGFNSLQVG